MLEVKARRPLWMEKACLGAAVGTHLGQAMGTRSHGPSRPLVKHGVSSARTDWQKGLSRAWHRLTHNTKGPLCTGRHRPWEMVLSQQATRFPWCSHNSDHLGPGQEQFHENLWRQGPTFNLPVQIPMCYLPSLRTTVREKKVETEILSRRLLQRSR